MLCTESAAKAITPGMHGTTFGGGPLVCAAAICVIDTIKNDGILDNVTEVGTYFMDELRKLGTRHAAIKEVRGLGLMVGVEIESAELAKDIAAQMFERHIILNRTSETVLRFLPPFLLERKHVDQTIAALDQILTHSPAYAGHAAGGTIHE